MKSEKAAQLIHAVVLTGGSAFGLAVINAVKDSVDYDSNTTTKSSPTMRNDFLIMTENTNTQNTNTENKKGGVTAYFDFTDLEKS